nr:hypothetical protein [Dehalogenimonas alkenigignens]
MRNDSRPSVFQPDRAPHKNSGIGFVSEHLVDCRPAPVLTFKSTKTVRIKFTGNGLATLVFQRHFKLELNNLDRNRIIRHGFEFVPELFAVLHLDDLVTIRRPGAVEEAALGIFHLATLDVLPHVQAVEFVDRFDDTLQEVSGR